MAGGHKGKQGRKANASTIAERERNQTSLTSVVQRVPAAPSHLNEVAKAEWRRMGKLLKDAGLLTNMDLTALTVYSAAYADYLEAEVMLQGPMGFCLNCDPRVDCEESGLGVLPGHKPCIAPYHHSVAFGKAIYRKGNFVTSPFVALNKQAYLGVNHFLVAFGMTPASRSRIPRDKIPDRPPRRTPPPDPNNNGGAPVDPRDVLKLGIQAAKN